MKRTLGFALTALAAVCLLVGSASVSFAGDETKKMESGTEKAAEKSGADMDKAGKDVKKAWDETKKETKDAEGHVKSHTEKDWDSATYKDSAGKPAAEPDAGAKKGEAEGE